MTVWQLRQRYARGSFPPFCISTSCFPIRIVHFTSLGDQTISRLECIHPASISFPQSGHFKGIPPQKNKNALCLSQETKCGKYTLRYHSRLPNPYGNRPLTACRHRPMLYRASIVHAYSRRLSAGGSKVIFALRFSPPYTNRRLSLQKPKGYSSLSTPKCSVHRFIISCFACLSRLSLAIFAPAGIQ